jgi:hypothetical protein
VNSDNLLARWAGKAAIIESHSIGAESPVDRALLRWMKERQDGTPGRFAAVGYSSNFDAVGHAQTGVIRDLLGGSIIAGNIISIVLPKLVLICMFPMPKLDYKCRCNLSLLQPLWPDIGAWQMIKTTPPFGEHVNPRRETVLALMGQVELFHPVV